MQQDVFPYWNGAVKVFGDPLQILNDLHEACDCQPNAWFEATKDKDNPLRAQDYANRIVAACRKVFRMTPFDPATGKGARLVDVYVVIEQFFDWLKKNGSDIGSAPTSSPGSA